jgi:long-chain acyl-CoA synthetase
MKRKLRGFKRSDVQLDFDLYRVNVPIPGVAGQELSVIDIWPEGVERTIMFVHGYAGCAETWEHQINYFSKEYRVVAPDLRGHGQSDAPFTRYTMQEMVADLNTVATYLKLPQQFVMVGHSFGGSICVEYAVAYPGRLERLVLIATAGEYPLPKAANLISRLPSSLLRPVWEYRPRWNAEAHVMKRMAVNNVMQWQGWALMRRISVPTLVITGERDNYFPRYVYEDVGRMIPNVHVVDVGASKHKVQLERHRAVNRTIERFIEEDERRMSWRDESIPRGPLDERPWLKVYGPDVPSTVPIPRQPLHRFLESTAESLPRETATHFFGASLTYRELDQQANQFAQALSSLGLRAGDRTMILLPNLPELVVATYGTLKTGGTVVFPSADAPAGQMVDMMAQSEARVLVTLRQFDRLATLAQQQGGVHQVIVVDMQSTEPAGMTAGMLDHWIISRPDLSSGMHGKPEGAWLMHLLVREQPTYFPSQQVDPEDLAAILYTSATTGTPKGVQLSHANLVANTVQARHWMPGLQYGQEVFLAVAPLMHSYGMTLAMNLPIAVGGSMVLLPAFDLDEVLHHIWTVKPSVFPALPAMIAAINEAPNVRSYGLSAIKTCLSGAAPLPVEVQETFEKLTQGRLIESYGLTEACSLTHAEPPAGLRKAGSVGVPLPNTDAAVVDLWTGAPMAPGQVGELLVKGPQVMAGYLDGGLTGDVLRDGWLHTGDVALMDADGFFRIIGRRHEIMVVDGHQVFPRDVEEVLYENSKVREAAVVGVVGPDGMQRVKAFVVPRPGTNLTEAELLDLCRHRLDSHAVPAEIELREEVPKSALGSVQRRKLEDGGG